MIYLHKILPLIVSPMFLVMFLITWGIVFRSRISGILAVSILIICSLPIFSNKLITYLENEYILSDASMRVSPIEDLNAEGFSTLTTQAHQDVQGNGNWSNNRWAVVFKRSLTNSDSNDTQFSGGQTPMAIAVWNGQNKERNGQKGVTQWNTLEY